jgi:hypothetical protein
LRSAPFAEDSGGVLPLVEDSGDLHPPAYDPVENHVRADREAAERGPKLFPRLSAQRILTQSVTCFEDCFHHFLRTIQIRRMIPEVLGDPFKII